MSQSFEDFAKEQELRSGYNKLAYTMAERAWKAALERAAQLLEDSADGLAANACDSPDEDSRLERATELRYGAAAIRALAEAE